MSDTWRTIPRTEVAKVVGISELAAFEETELAEGETAPVEKLIGDVVQQFRDAIRSQPTNQLSDGETLPAGAIPEALVIMRYRAHTRIGIAVNEERSEEYKQARRYMEAIAKGVYRFTAPDDVTDEAAQSANPSPSYTARARADHGL